MGEATLSWTPPKASPFGLRVARILDDIWALYNMRLQRVDFSHDSLVEVNIERSLSTFDFDELTQLVIRCHDACIRLTVQPCNMRYLKLQFHPRAGRQGATWDRHPTIESAIDRVRTFTYFNKRAVTPQEPVPTLGAVTGEDCAVDRPAAERPLKVLRAHDLSPSGLPPVDAQAEQVKR